MAIFNSYVSHNQRVQSHYSPIVYHYSLTISTGSFYMVGYEPLSGHPHYIPIMFPLHPHHIRLIVFPYIPVYPHILPLYFH